MQSPARSMHSPIPFDWITDLLLLLRGRDGFVRCLGLGRGLGRGPGLGGGRAGCAIRQSQELDCRHVVAKKREEREDTGCPTIPCPPTRVRVDG